MTMIIIIIINIIFNTIIIITIITIIIFITVSQEALQGIQLCAQKMLDKEVRLSIRLDA
jgi:hypothetical protein